MNTDSLLSYLFVKNTTKIKISASQGISNMNYDNKIGLFQFQSGYRKFYLNSPKGYILYSRKIINAQTV